MQRAVSQDTIDELLANRAWLQRLARSLVGSAQVAEDLVQETYESALRSPPDGERAMRPWLRQVLRNAARMRWRGDARRERREREADVAAAEPTPETALARVRAHRRLAELVEELAEPIRSAILLRYVEGLSAAEIARRTDEPAGTVRWRIKRGLDELRAALDGDSGGDRTAWQVALVPLSAAAETAPAGLLGGVFAMKLMTKLIAGVVLVGGIAAVAVVTTRGDDAKPPSTPTEAAAPTSAVAPAPTPDRPEAATAQAPPSLPRKLPNREARERLERDIARARARRETTKPPAAKPRATTTSSGDGADFDKEYIRDRMQDLIPLVKECYDMALERDPTLEGKMVVDFNIVGEPDVGGLVETSEIDLDESTLTDPGVVECVRETMYAMELEPPPNGGSVRVRYPITFRSDPSQSDDM